MNTDIYIVDDNGIPCVSVPVVKRVLIPLREFKGERTEVVTRLGEKYPDTDVVERLRAYSFVKNTKETICEES